MAIQQKWIEKQNEFCDYCMELPVLTTDIRRYRHKENTLMQKEDGNTDWATFNVCCLYPYGQNKTRGKKGVYELFRNYMRMEDMKKCTDAFNDEDYKWMIAVISYLKSKYSELVVYLPVLTASTWSKFKKHHYGQLFEVLDNLGVVHIDDISKIKARGKRLCVLVFDIFTNKTRIIKTVHDELLTLTKYEPRILHISMIHEVNTESNPI
ncbi:MAG: hypothetical protein J6X86_07260 [Bacteroidales bacterium]|nr:hypothetical protein [Bacteroidales bacterium]